MSFERFEQVKASRGTTYATIDKYGRLIVPSAICQQTGLKGGDDIELYFDPKTRDVGFRIMESETFYSIRAKWNGKHDPDSKYQQSVIVPLQSMLTAYGIRLVRKIRGRMNVTPDGLVVFKIGEVTTDPLSPNAAVVDRGMAALFAEVAA